MTQASRPSEAGRVAAELRLDIVEGRLAGRLPGHDVMAERYRVSRVTLRKAVSVLIEEGLLDVRHGSGSYVRPVQGVTRTIALVVAPDLARHHTDLYHQRMLTSMIYACAERGWLLRIAPNIEDLACRMRGPHSAAVSGCLAIAFGKEHHDGLRALPVPVVNVDGDPIAGSGSILPDNAGGVRLAIRHLASLGHVRIAHLAGAPGKLASEERATAFAEAMAELGLPVPDGFIEFGNFTMDAGRDAMRRWWLREPRPTAVFCANDMMAIGACKWAWEHGLRVGHDVSIVGCDGLAVGYMIWPTLTTLSIDFARHAEHALSCLGGAIAGGTVVRTPFSLTERESSGRPR